jgi:hypothetical protein
MSTATEQLPTHHIKVRELGRKSWAFLSSNGTTRLRVHALQFTQERAAALIAENAPDNPEWEFKATPIA